MAGRTCPNCQAGISWREILEESTLGLSCRQCRTPLETDRRYRTLALLVGLLVAVLAQRLLGSTPAREFLALLLGMFVGSGLAALALVQVRQKSDDQGFM